MKYTRKLHREDEALRPLTNDVSDDNELVSNSRYLTLDEEESGFISPPIRGHQSPPLNNAHSNSPSLYEENAPVEENKQLSDKRARRKKQKTVPQSIIEKPKFTKENRQQTKTIEKMEGLMDDYLIPVHRSKASELLGNNDDHDNGDEENDSNNNDKEILLVKKSLKHKKTHKVVEKKDKKQLRKVTPPSSKTPQTKKKIFNRPLSVSFLPFSAQLKSDFKQKNAQNFRATLRFSEKGSANFNMHLAQNLVLFQKRY